MCCLSYELVAYGLMVRCQNMSRTGLDSARGYWYLIKKKQHSMYCIF